MVPSGAVRGSTISNGAPSAIVALNPSVPTFASDTPSWNVVPGLPWSQTKLSSVKPENSPGGNVFSWFPCAETSLNRGVVAKIVAGRAIKLVLGDSQYCQFGGVGEHGVGECCQAVA